MGRTRPAVRNSKVTSREADREFEWSVCVGLFWRALWLHLEGTLEIRCQPSRMLAAAEREKAIAKDCAMACEAKLLTREQQVITIA